MKKNIPYLKTACALAAALGVCAAEPEEKKGMVALLAKDAIDSSQPTEITAERFEFDYKSMVAVFDENVEVKHPQFYLRSDRAFVFFDSTNDVKNILVTGNVEMTNENRRATCDRALYSREEGTLVMTGETQSAKLSRGFDSVAGDQITVWIADERMEVTGNSLGSGERSKIIIGPGTLKRQESERKPPKENVKEEAAVAEVEAVPQDEPDPVEKPKPEEKENRWKKPRVLLEGGDKEKTDEDLPSLFRLPSERN